MLIVSTSLPVSRETILRPTDLTASTATPVSHSFSLGQMNWFHAN